MPSYWLVDPDLLTVTVLELRDGVYEEVAVIGEGEEREVLRPFPGRVVPARLRD